MACLIWQRMQALVGKFCTSIPASFCFSAHVLHHFRAFFGQPLSPYAAVLPHSQRLPLRSTVSQVCFLAQVPHHRRLRLSSPFWP